MVLSPSCLFINSVVRGEVSQPRSQRPVLPPCLCNCVALGTLGTSLSCGSLLCEIRPLIEHPSCAGGAKGDNAR